MTSQSFKKLLVAIFPCLIVAGVLFFFFHPRTVEIKSEKNGWQILEEPEFQLEGVKKGAKIKVFLIDPKGKVLSLEEGKDFEIRSSSPTKIKILKNEDKLMPGLYKIKIEIEENGKTETLEKAFPWGVLAINTNKSIYLPGETAYIQMAVLGDDGHTICDAKLELQITNPKSQTTIFSTEDGTIQKSDQCGPDNVTEKPDYFAYYKVEKPGIYKMKLKNLDLGYEIEDSFEVRESVPFDVERIGPTRIWPKAPYEMTLKIKANQDFKGKIVETVPRDFSIVECQNCSPLEKPVQDFKELALNVEMKKGENYELKYKFDAPDVSPYLYLLGPLSFTENGSREAVFQEARHWQVVADAPDTLILRPNATGTYQQWSTFGDTVHWILTSDQNDNTGVQVTGTTTLKETENLADTTQAGTINSVTAYMRAKASSSTETYTLYAHQETITIAGTTYYLLKTTSADAAGTTISRTSSAGGDDNLRILFGKFVFQLSDVVSIPASTWTIYYRQYYSIGSGGNLQSAHYDVDILIRKSDGTIRTTIATDVATSSALTTSWSTATGTYAFPGYTVVDPTDYLEIDFYVHESSKKVTFYFRFDDQTLNLTDQTRVEGVSLDYPEKAVIVWRTYSTDYESSATTVARTAFTDYSETRTVNPYTGQAWTWDEINNLEIGARATQLGSSDTIQVSEFWIVVNYTPPFNVSGYAYENDGTTPWSGCDGTSKNVALAVNGTLTATTSCSTSTGAFSFSIPPPATSTPMVIYFKGVSGNYGSNVNRYSGSGDVTGIVVRKNAVIVQHDDSGPITNADLNSWDNDNDPDVNYVVTNGNLTVEAGSKLIINSNDTFTPGGTVTIENGDLLMMSSSTLTANNSVTVNGDLSISSGATLNGTSSVTVNGGDATGDGTINLTGGTFTLDGAGYFGGNSNWTFYNLTFGGDSNVETTTATGTGEITVSGVLTIGANQTLNAGSKKWNLLGLGTPFVINGNFNASSSTFTYIGQSFTYIGQSGWLSGWSYRRPVTITNTTFALTDYQVLITLDTQTLISQGKASSTCADLRFTDSDGTTSLNYWLESGCNTTSTKIWVKVPNIPASSTKTIYVYYGNPSATSASNPSTTLVIYENWDSGTLDGWTMYTKGGYSASINTSEGNPPPEVYISGDAPTGGDINHFIYKTINKQAGVGLRLIADHAGYHGYYTTNVYTRYFIYTSGGDFIESYDYSGDANNVWIYNDQYLATNSDTLSNTTLRVGFGLWDAWDANWSQNARFDNIRVMLYTSPEPTTSVGGEEALLYVNISAATYNNLEILPQIDGFTFIFGTGTGQTIATNGYLTIGNGTNAVTTTADIYDPILDINGDFTISSNATFIASNISPAYFAKNWTNNGTFVHSTGTIVFDGSTTSTLSGATTFYNLTCTTPSKNLIFPSGVTQTIEGRLVLDGQNCSSPIVLRSSSPGTQWKINVVFIDAANVFHVDVKDSNAIGDEIVAYRSIDSGNNTNWTIYPCEFSPILKGGIRIKGGVRLK